jgi:SAM-dependent methyltransferase
VFSCDYYLYFYKDNIITEEQTKREIEFLKNYANLDKTLRILDLACGYGRHTNKLAALGHLVTGIDINPCFLKHAKKDAKMKGLKVEYINQDMQEISFSNMFDRIFLIGISFGYFDDKGNLILLKKISRALKPKGLFCFDLLNRDVLLKYLYPFSVIEKGDDLVIDQNIFDPLKGYLYIKRTVIIKGKREEFSFSIRIYNLTETNELLKKAGFKILNIYTDWDGKTSPDGRILILITEKI